MLAYTGSDEPTTVSTGLGGEAARSRYSPGRISDIGLAASKMQTGNEMARYRGWKANKVRRELIAKHQIVKMKKRIESK